MIPLFARRPRMFDIPEGSQMFVYIRNFGELAVDVFPFALELRD